MNDELYHWRTRGSKNGIRRFQNEDGSYKPGAEGRYDPEPTGRRRGTSDKDTNYTYHNPKRDELEKLRSENAKTAYETDRMKAERDSYNSQPIEINQNDRKSSGMSFAKKAAIATASVAAIGAAAYLGKKYLDNSGSSSKIRELFSKGKEATKTVVKESTKDTVKDVVTEKKTRTRKPKTDTGKKYAESVDFETIRKGANKKEGNDWYQDYIAYIAMNTPLKI